MFAAIVLAGGVSKDLSAEDMPKNEALLDIGGRPMLFFVLAALEKSRFIDRIFVVGPLAKLKRLGFSEKVQLVQSGANIIDTLAAGVKATASARDVLIATVDIPLLTTAAVDDFIEKCQREAADLCYPVIARETVERQFPEAERTYVRLRDGAFTGGNLFFANPAILPKCMTVARRIAANRKKPWRLAALLGWTTLLKFSLGRLSLADAQAAVSEMLGIKGRVIRSEWAVIGMDVDKSGDLELAKRYLDNKIEN